MVAKAIIEAKKSITPSMIESDEKGGGRPFNAAIRRRGEGPS